MSEQSPLVYSVPTHLREREPFAFGRTLGEVAKLVVVGYLAARLVGSDGLPAALRLPAAVVVVLVGATWAWCTFNVVRWTAGSSSHSGTVRRRVDASGGPVAPD
jgi:hypothetical protein